MEASSRSQQIVNGTITPPPGSMNKSQISFTDETSSDPEIQTNWDGETTIRSDEESSAESSTSPNQIRSKIAKSRPSPKLQRTISMKDEAAAGYYSRPKRQKRQHMVSQLNSRVGKASSTPAISGTSTIRGTSSSSTSSVNCCPSEDGSYLCERRFIYAMDSLVDKLYARVTLMDYSCRLAAFFCTDWSLEQLRNFIKSRLPDHNVKRLLYENYDLRKFVRIIDDNDLKECFRVSNDSVVNLMVDAQK